jgi:ABC-type metal ion transport system substrate-binding protein
MTNCMKAFKMLEKIAKGENPSMRQRTLDILVEDGLVTVEQGSGAFDMTYKLIATQKGLELIEEARA